MSPSFGPAVVTLFGMDVPVMAFGLSLLGLLLARSIAPQSRRKLTRFQEWALTILLIIVLLLVVSGELFGSQPLGPGMGVAWGVGLGTSGLLAIELFGKWTMSVAHRMLYGFTVPLPEGDEKPPAP